MDELPAYTPQSITDLLPIYHPPNAADDHIQTYTLLQTSPSSQILTTSPPTTPNLTIKTFQTGGFMNRKPHIIISQPSPTTTNNSKTPNLPLAEARFDIHGTGTSITYPSAPSPHRTQRLELSSSRLQILSTTIAHHPHWWRPFPGNKDVWELSNEQEEVIARFVHAPCPASPSTSPVLPSSAAPLSPPASPPTRTNSVFSISSATSTENNSSAQRSKGKKGKEPVVLGQLHVVTSALVSEDSVAELNEILCSAIAVVERMRRRRGFLEGQKGRLGGREVGRNGVGYIPQ